MPVTQVTRSLIVIILVLITTGLRAESNRPNIIYFLSDDHRADFLGCAGHPIVKTPTIDSMASQGVRFANSFVTTSICAASRASIFTGLVERTHLYTFGTPPIRSDYVANSYPVLLKNAGYQTGFIGKFGVSVPRGSQGQMFDVYRPLNRSPYFKKQPDGTRRHTSEICGDWAIEFIDQAPKDRPFCLSVSFNAAHAEDGDKVNHFPWPKAVDGLYDDVAIPEPDLSDPKVFESQPAFLRKSMNRQRYFWRWDTREKYERNVRAYYRMITGLDRVIGRVREALEDRGLADNTIIIFSGDNGYYKAARGFAGKWSHYEESLRVPLVVFDPRLEQSKRGRVADEIALNIDIPATIISYAGLKVPDSCQGASLVGIVNQSLTTAEKNAWRSDFFCEHLMDHGAIPKWEGVRGERYVYARYFQQKPVFEFLHDLQDDPKQLKNLVNDQSYQAVLAKMRSRCNELRDGYGGEWSNQHIVEYRKRKSEEAKKRNAVRQKANQKK